MVGAFSQVAVMILSVSDYFGRELTGYLSHRESRICALTSAALEDGTTRFLAPVFPERIELSTSDESGLRSKPLS